MWKFTVYGVLLALAVAEPTYGHGASGGYDDNQSQYRPQVFRHVYTFAAPDEPVHPTSRVIRVPGGDKHVNVIFIKAPSSSSSQKTELILPEQDQQKNIVYVLLKKGDNKSDIKISRPPSSPPRKPQVHFIQYRDQKNTNNPGYPNPPSPSPIYGQY